MSGELVKTEETLPAVQVSQSDSLLQAIVSASSNSEIDVEKMERLWAMKEKIDAKDAEIAFNAAMAETQSEMRPIAADANNPQTRSRYASYAALDKALRPIYSRHGFALSFDEGDSSKESHVRVLCYLSHKKGHSRTHHTDMCADGKGAKGGDVMTKTHASGAAMTYGMRYLLKMIFNVAIGEDDTDGNVPVKLINHQQVTSLVNLITEVGTTKEAFAKVCKITFLEELPTSKYDGAIRRLEQKRKDNAGS
ncbi:MAG: ERF family protein [Desulfobacterales bacterium]